MPSSTSSSDAAAWRRFFATLFGVGGGAALFVYLFVVLTNPFGDLPVSAPFARWPVDGNARYSFPFLARSPQFDSAVFGTSVSRLFRPALLDQMFGAHFANLSMNSATAYEQSRLLDVFLARHPAPRVVMIGLDLPWCVDPGGFVEHTPEFAFPDWLYGGSRWADYLHVANLYAVERAGQAFAEWTGLKRRVYGLDGYTRFVPDESRYDPARVAALMSPAEPWQPPDLGDDPARWSMPGIDLLRHDLAKLPPQTRKVLLFSAVSFRLIPQPDTRAGAWLAECKRRVAEIAGGLDRATVIDFAFLSPVTTEPDHYWDAWHFRVGIADRIVTDVAAALRGAASPDYRVLQQDRLQQSSDDDRHEDARRVEAGEPK
ncbi:MAG TPA: hypothetical protein VHS58_10140 [Acetobacteraceae bacterium]|jgi:hypothetical protein|nr:hypothetical protein [Acetobacteraceae bacterium]